MMSIYKDRPGWAWRSSNSIQSQEPLLPQDQPAIPMSRLIDRLGVNKLLIPITIIINVAIAVVAAALLIWNGVCLLTIYPLNNYRLKADCKSRYTSRDLDRRHIEAISLEYTFHLVFCSKLFNSFFWFLVIHEYFENVFTFG